jgi:hypothetical protein
VESLTMKMPNVDAMLPSAAKLALEEFFLERILAKGVNYRGEPKYTYTDVLSDVGDVGSYSHSIAHECYQAAVRAFDRKHPLCWDNENQKAYRAFRKDLG